MPSVEQHEANFPAPYDGSPEAVRHLFEQICEYMEIDAAKLELKLYNEMRKTRRALGLRGNYCGTAGLYDSREGRTIIWLEESNLGDPMSVAATLAHELCHEHLLGGDRISREEADHEPLTDLATIFFGLGVFTANASLHSRSGQSGGWQYWSVSRQGYLIDTVLGYALALYAWVREETPPTWDCHLRADIRALVGQSLAYLEHVDDDVLMPLKKGEVPSAGPYSPELVARLLLQKPRRDEARAEEAHVAHDAEHSKSDDDFTQAVFLIERKKFDEAVAILTGLLRDDPNDGDAYLQRAIARLGRRDFRDALADADQAVRHAPDDPDCYRVRGQAHFRLQHYEMAIDDLDFYLQEEDGGAAATRDRAMAHYYRGLAASSLNEFDNAVADLTRAIRHVPRWADAYDARADVYHRMGEFAKAAADRSEAHDLRMTTD